ncbi:SDR family oxidoreductase [Rothia uropygialis]|uniref:SDR family oxidoreductase n=1 Tax=Kocuria sp. 36 TaxID=1415402 RepID=UPI00101D5051|nr:SDR family oxidoreductase [Kocuria sp. 36]
MQRFQNRRVVITGAATGIGQASARRLGEEGATLALVDVNSDDLAKTADSVRETGAEVQTHVVDISDEEAVKGLASELGRAWGGVDVLINNAGVDSKGGKVHEYPTELFDKIIAVDLRGTFLMTKYLVPLMFEHGKGAIVNMASFSGLAADADRSGYNAAKGGVVNFTRATATDYGSRNIRANAVCPGTIETPLVDELVGGADAEGKSFREQQARVTPLERLGKPEEVAAVVAFLASDDSSFVTGETITVDGGVMAYTWPANVLTS